MFDCKWPYVLKKDGATFLTGETGRDVSLELSGPGKYALYLNGGSSPVCEKTVERKNDCYIKDKKSSYKYGETFTFVVENLTATTTSHCWGWSCDYYWTYTFGMSGSSQTQRVNQDYNNQRLTVNTTAKTSGTYSFVGGNKLEGDCSDDIIVESRALTCTRNQNKLYIQTTGCDKGCKVYYQKNDEYYPNSVTITNDKVIENIRQNDRYKVYFDDESSNKINCDNGTVPLNPNIQCSLNRYSGNVTVTANDCDNGCHYMLYKGTQMPSNYDDPRAYPENVASGTIYNENKEHKKLGDYWYRVVIIENGSEIAVGTCK